MKAMIFAAGLGKRLGKLTETQPKALVDINGKTALQRAVEKCNYHGFSDIIVNIHHFADLVENEITHLRDLGFRISVSDERDLLLETGGGLYKARNFFDNTPFLLYNVDIITDIDLSGLYRFHLESGGLATLAVRNRRDNRFFLTDKNGLIKGWCNKTTGEVVIPGKPENDLSEIAFSGIHVVSSEIFSFMEPGIYSMTSLYLKILNDTKIMTFVHNNGYWFDVGDPESLENARRYLAKN